MNSGKLWKIQDLTPIIIFKIFPQKIIIWTRKLKIFRNSSEILAERKLPKIWCFYRTVNRSRFGRKFQEILKENERDKNIFIAKDDHKDVAGQLMEKILTDAVKQVNHFYLKKLFDFYKSELQVYFRFKKSDLKKWIIRSKMADTDIRSKWPTHVFISFRYFLKVPDLGDLSFAFINHSKNTPFLTWGLFDLGPFLTFGHFWPWANFDLEPFWPGAICKIGHFWPNYFGLISATFDFITHYSESFLQPSVKRFYTDESLNKKLNPTSFNIRKRFWNLRKDFRLKTFIFKFKFSKKTLLFIQTH